MVGLIILGSLVGNILFFILFTKHKRLCYRSSIIGIFSQYGPDDYFSLPNSHNNSVQRLAISFHWLPNTWISLAGLLSHLLVNDGLTGI